MDLCGIVVYNLRQYKLYNTIQCVYASISFFELSSQARDSFNILFDIKLGFSLMSYPHCIRNNLLFLSLLLHKSIDMDFIRISASIISFESKIFTVNFMENSYEYIEFFFVKIHFLCRQQTLKIVYKLKITHFKEVAAVFMLYVNALHTQMIKRTGMQEKKFVKFNIPLT